MSTAALYYPNVTVVDPRRSGESQDYTQTDIGLLSTAILLWDSLEVIVPWEGFRIPVEVGRSQLEEDEAIRDAFELVVKPRALTEKEKQKVHTRLADLISKGVPNSLRFEVQVDNFNMYPSKMLPETWDMLKDAGLSSIGTYGYQGLQRDFALVVMGVVAEICAGKTKRKVTNYSDAHSAYSRLIGAREEEEPDFKPDLQGAYGSFASIGLKAVDATEFPLQKLVELRKREEKDGLLPPLRRNYRNALDRYVERLSKEAESASDVQQIESEFEAEIRDDFRHLREILKLERADATLKGTSILAALFSGKWLTAAGSLMSAFPAYKLKRQLVLEKHSSSWLHVAGVVDPK